MDTAAFCTGPRNVALFMHINFKLERMGKLFLSQFQSHTSQAFSTSLFVCYFIKANCTKGDQHTQDRIQAGLLDKSSIKNYWCSSEVLLTELTLPITFGQNSVDLTGLEPPQHGDCLF